MKWQPLIDGYGIYCNIFRTDIAVVEDNKGCLCCSIRPSSKSVEAVERR
ncbi:hypothetical protein GCWU000282_02368 [Catonella morbi ATCC 51271]|uniref:Uncharacterized protein n=1 Tax=Catonella morbi ATCC 51271 TaxID=592026 RepID=V2XJA4_9FIRM|nr:hypothetical protein GCWU000282_02368 [Catonella morbi ATCC 51271]